MFKLNNIAVLVDQTPDAALQLADKLAAIDGGVVHLFSIKRAPVVPVTTMGAPVAVLGGRQQTAQELAHRRREHVAAAKELEAEADVTVGHGILEEQFLQFLDESDIDLAITSHQGISWWSRLIESNATGQASRRSTTPILAVGTAASIEAIVKNGICSVMVATMRKSDVFAAACYSSKLGNPGMHIAFASPADGLDFDLDLTVKDATSATYARTTLIPIEGSFVSEFIEKAKALRPDLFIVGSQPHESLSDRVLGTTSDSLLAMTKERPVLVIPQRERERAEINHQLDDALATAMPASDPYPAH